MHSSFSEPNSPLKEVLLGEKWQTASCSDIGADYVKPGPLAKAKFTALRNKREAIDRFLKKHRNDDLGLYIEELRDFAISPGGLVDDEFRAIIWPVLSANLVINDDLDDVSSSYDSDFESAQSDFEDSPPYEEIGELTLEDLKGHKEWNQVELDVHRTLSRFPPNISDTHRDILQTDLIPLIVRVLCINPRFNYYQGFHDICLTVLLVCGQQDALSVCSNLAKNGAFNNYLLKTLEKSVVRELDLLYVILSRVEPSLERVMRSVELGTMFALSWPLTWLSHSVKQYQQIVRFFDVFLASSPLLPIYVASAVVVYRRPSILACEREMPFLHRLLTEMPHELPIDAIIKDAVYLSRLMPPCLLKTKYMNEYRKIVAKPPRAAVKTIPRYALQFMFVAGTVGAAASFFFFKQIHPM
uniref:Rab-GAP TBC domain-containing protein n=1 Tax=Caenorhabditis japonica TaxID=281687 RepID=A0A8R1I470_CAEJA